LAQAERAQAALLACGVVALPAGQPDTCLVKENCDLAVAMLKVALVSLMLTAAESVAYGPGGCVSLDRSPQGTCVIKTNCQGVSTSKFEFAFDCLASGAPKTQIQRHSFGEGGFDDVEEFDTEVTCQSCMEPEGMQLVAQAVHVPIAIAAGAPHALVAATVQSAAKTESKAEGSSKIWPFSESSAPVKASVAPSGKVVSYGPSDCVSTFKNNENHCVMQTACDDVKREEPAAWSSYEFGLICVDANGVPTRHVFGKDSFDSIETFDTLIECDQCIGLDDVSDDVALTGQVVVLADEIKSISGMMKNITKDVDTLNKKVFPQSETGNASSNISGGKEGAKENVSVEVKEPPADSANSLSHTASKTMVTNQHRHIVKVKASRGHRHLRHVRDERVERDHDAEESEEEGAGKQHRLRHHATRRVAQRAKHKKMHKRLEQEEQSADEVQDAQRVEEQDDEAQEVGEEDNEDEEAEREQEQEKDDEGEEDEAGEEHDAEADSALVDAESEDMSQVQDANEPAVTKMVRYTRHEKKSPLSRHRHTREEGHLEDEDATNAYGETTQGLDSDAGEIADEEGNK